MSALSLPLLLGLAASLGLLLLRPRPAALALTAAAAVITALYAQHLPQVAGGTVAHEPFWSVPALGIAGGLALDGLSLAFALLIAGIGALVFLYTGAYSAGKPEQRGLLVMLGLFMTAMLGAVTSDDIVVLFIFWELTSLASFFLVGTNHKDPRARAAALQALLVTGGGGLVLLAGLVLIALAAGTTSLSGIVAARDVVLADPLSGVAMALIIIGCFTKSAQVPFHFWLPNAMAAPTPVSAYLHSATMVKLGVYLLARLNPLYQDVAAWEAVLTWFGIATAVTGAVLALRETDLKRVLAYTTVTALGTLVMLIGIAPELSATAAVTFLVVHAFYKAALFLVAGIVDHETGTRDARQLGGLARAMPVTAIAATLAALSMAGLPPFVGFVAKELVYEAKLEAGAAAGPLLLAGFLVNAVSVAIAGVLSLRLFLGRRRPTPTVPHDPPLAMSAGPLLLATLGLVVGSAPGAFGYLFVEPAVLAMLGRPADVALKLWHGFNLVLALSAATVALGVLLYLLWERLVRGLRRVALIESVGPARGYERLLAGLMRSADDVTRAVQHGSLHGYLATVFVVTATGLLATLALRGGFDAPAFVLDELDARAVAFLLVALGVAGVALARTVLVAVMASGLVGFAVALVFLFFGAADVAFTQFAVETLLLVILATVLVRLPFRGKDDRRPARKAADGAVALLTGGAVAAVLLAVLAAPFDPSLPLWFGAESVPSAHGRNVVNVILVDFRALDTLGEIMVLAITAFAIVALLRRASLERTP